MPPRKRKQRSAKAASSSTPAPSSRRNRRSPALLSSEQGKGSAQGQTKSHSSSKRPKPSMFSLAEGEEDERTMQAKKTEKDLIAGRTMHTITHHTSFVPTLASPQLDANDDSYAHGIGHSSSSKYANCTGASTGAGTGTGTGDNLLISGLATGSSSTNAYHHASSAISIHSNNSRNNSNTNTGAIDRNDRPYALYHPRNLGLVPPTVTPPEQYKTQTVPHSAGCRMKYLPQPSFRTLPFHPDFQKSQTDNEDDEGYIQTAGLTCPTVMNNSHPHSGQIAIGDTGGFVTLYTTTPIFLPITKLHTSASARFIQSQQKRKKKKTKRIGRGIAVVGSSIDRANAVDGLVLLKKAKCVIIATRLEIECVGFENEVRWTSKRDFDDVGDGCTNISSGWDSLEGKVMGRGIPLRMNGDEDDSFVLASFGFFPLKERASLKSRKNSDADAGADASANLDAVNTTTSGDAQAGANEENDHSDSSDSSKIKRPGLYSPILKINVATGEFSNVVPMEKREIDISCSSSDDRARAVTCNGGDTGDRHHTLESGTTHVTSCTEWKECNVGTRAMAIHDKLHRGNIVCVFIIYRHPSTNNHTQVAEHSTSGTATVIANSANDTAASSATALVPNSTASSDLSSSFIATQELMILDADYHILHRTVVPVPTKSSGTKLVTVEAINQSPNGDFTISATPKRGVLVYRTDGLQLLGAYGGGVSLHGHSIVWQDIFFIRVDKTDADKSKANCEDDVEKQWGKILERSDELMQREKYKLKRKEMSQDRDSLNQLFIVSVPSAFREPVDMKEHIQFWDVSRLEFDGGNTLPSFELLAPKKSEGICSLLYDHSMMTSNAGKFIMSTHAGDCLELTPTLVSDWAGQMYPTGFLVIDNNLTYIEDEDELDQVVDSHLDQNDFCQPIGTETNFNSTQNEAELSLALQMSLMDEHIDVIGNDGVEWNESLSNIAPCRPEPHLRMKSKMKSKDPTQAVNTVQGSSSYGSMFDVIKLLPQMDAVKHRVKERISEAKQRKARIEETTRKLAEPPIKIPRRKQGNIDHIINASVDKQLTIRMLEKIGPADGTGGTFRSTSTYNQVDPLKRESMSTANENISGPPVTEFENGEKSISIDQCTVPCGKVAPMQESTSTQSDVETAKLAHSTTTIDSQRMPSTNLENYCAACHGRFVIHACGKRARPIDYDAIAKAEQDRKDKEEAEKKKLQQDRRKLAEQKRKEKKIKKKEEEKKKKLLEEHEEERKKNEVQTSLDLTKCDPSQANNDCSLSGLQSSPHQSSMQNMMTSPQDYPTSSGHFQPSYSHQSSYYQQPQHGLPPSISQNSSQMYQHEEVNGNFGDSMFSNIPSLPTEPSVLPYGNGGNKT